MSEGDAVSVDQWLAHDTSKDDSERCMYWHARWTGGYGGDEGARRYAQTMAEKVCEKRRADLKAAEAKEREEKAAAEAANRAEGERTQAKWKKEAEEKALRSDKHAAEVTEAELASGKCSEERRSELQSLLQQTKSLLEAPREKQDEFGRVERDSRTATLVGHEIVMLKPSGTAVSFQSVLRGEYHVLTFPPADGHPG